MSVTATENKGTSLAMKLAISAKSGGGTSVDDVTDLVSSHVGDCCDAYFYPLRNEVLALIPSAPFCQREADAWAHASARCRAEDRAERFTPYGC